jgi:hypothetical protein
VYYDFIVHSGDETSGYAWFTELTEGLQFIISGTSVLSALTFMHACHCSILPLVLSNIFYNFNYIFSIGV